jgi:phosphoglycerate dehydrogenase-like enzyme
MSDRSDRHHVLYWNRATPELYAVIREEAPAELRPEFLETEDPAEARAKLGRAEFLIIADWALTGKDLEAAPRLRMVQHQGVGYERIAGAGLDVFTPEPLAPGHPLTTLDNVVLTPHVGAGTLDAFRTKMRFALGNIQRVVQGEPPLERVPEA